MERFIDKIISQNETLLEEVREHWIEMAAPTAILLILVLLALVLEITQLLAGAWGFVIFVLLVLAGAGHFAYRYIRWSSKYLFLTNRRVVVVSGILSRKTNEIPISRITDIRCNQGIFGRILNFGSLDIQSAGNDASEAMGNIPHPFDIRNKVDALASSPSSYDPPVGEVKGRSDQAVETIERLSRLYRDGFIDEAEFKRLKAKVFEDQEDS